MNVCEDVASVTISQNILQLSINELEKLDFELAKRGKMSKDENDPQNMLTNANDLKRLISMTKQFRDYLIEFDIDQPSIREF